MKLFFFVYLIIFTPSPQPDDELVDKLKSGWSRIDALTPEVKHLAVTRKNTGCEDLDPIDQEIVLKKKGDAFVRYSIDHRSNTQAVTGLNNDHSFDLSGGVEKQYVIDELVRIESDNSRSLAGTRRYLQRLERHEATFFFKIVSWERISSSKGFKIANQREIEVEGQHAIEIEFECNPTESERAVDPRGDSAKPIPIIRNGKATFLKNLDYLPLRWEVDVKFPPDDGFFNVKIDQEFEFLGVKTSLSKRTRTTSYKGMVDVETLEFQYLDPGEISSSDFRLPAFGLPEPPFVQSRGFSYGRITIIGLSVFAIGLFLVRNYRS